MQDKGGFAVSNIGSVDVVADLETRRTCCVLQFRSAPSHIFFPFRAVFCFSYLLGFSPFSFDLPSNVM
ncbi:hypothetical protein E2542_SST22953 [Spatholobus suberectus]|nr:hypothetical protein E2542_SST22953 [Spatholobus suberectus]